MNRLSPRLWILAVAIILVVGCHDSGRYYENRMVLGEGEADGGTRHRPPPAPRECPLNYVCLDETLGRGGDVPWDLEGDVNDGVGLDEQAGGLVLRSTSIISYFIWVANTPEGTVSKVDVRTFEEAGRYRTGLDPSRTSVNTLGDVFVGNRRGRSLTKVSALGEFCPDTNGDGRITTSTGHELLAPGQDDCVLWSVDLSFPERCGQIRAVAAQDELGPDGEVFPYVWVGGDGGCIWKLDGETGEILIDAAPAPVPPYGFALDAGGNLWIEAVGGRELGRLDTRRCRDLDSCPRWACEGARGQYCIMERIQQPLRGYGITVDSRQRVWVGGGVARYDPSLPYGERWTEVGAPHFVHGIAADGQGWIWGAALGSVLRFNAEAPWEYTEVERACGLSAKGAAVDDLGQVWMINQSHENATVIRPGPSSEDAEVQTNVADFLSRPYTYSDMTGTQLRLATRANASYRHTFEGCDWTDPIWEELDSELFLPEGTQVTFRVRTAPDHETLEATPWLTLGTAPTDEPPYSLEEAFLEAEVAPARLLEVELLLATERIAEARSVSPEVFDLDVRYRCYAFFG